MTKYGGFFDLASKQARLSQLQDQIDGDPQFWDDLKTSQKVLKEKKQLEDDIEESQALKDQLSDIEAALELASEGPEFIAESETLLLDFIKKLQVVETRCLLSDPSDSCNALLTINAGAGGTESCDWASMILRMYKRFAERNSWQVELHDVQAGDEAGIKSVTLELTGSYVFGQLKSEIGVHRLVRISPFDSNARRHTSFASVFISPVIDDEIEVEINPADLRIDTYRASGAGGQHVNRTDSAVRITHMPSQIVVQCQSQRSQHQNKDTAMKMLRSKLYEKELEKRKKEQQALESSKSEIGFGSQIRSYVLHPYKMVKDHRTSKESHSPDNILDGELSEFIHAFLTFSQS